MALSPTQNVLQPFAPPTRPNPSGVYDRRDLRRNQTLDCDVVIIGSGAGGGTLAAELAEGGLSVIVLEEGDYTPTEDFTTVSSDMVRKLYRDMGTTMAFGAPPVLYQEGCTVGGSTVINGAMSWRTPDHILTQWEKMAGGVEAISASDLEPFYKRVEKRIHVAYQDPETIGEDNRILKDGADKMGWDVIPNRRNQLHCAGTNNCAFGCPTKAKRSVLVTYIPRALHYGAQVLANVRADKILRKGKRAIGVRGHVVEANGKRGATITVRSKLTVSSCGAIHTPGLLHRSGFRSPSNQLGKNLWLHPNSKVMAIFDHDVRGWEGVHQAYQVREFGDEGILMAAVNVPPGVVAMGSPYYGAELGELMKDYDRTVVAGLLLEDSHPGRVFTLPGGRPVATYQLSDRDAAKLKWGICRLCELLFSMGARKIILPFADSKPLTHIDDVKRLEESKVRKSGIEVVTVHLMGTARMGRDRTDAVTDSYGAFHNADRLMVCDASLFPGPIGVNPAQTIQTLATRQAAHILSNRRRYTQ